MKHNKNRQLLCDGIVLILILLGSNSLISQNVLSTQLSLILDTLILGVTVLFSARKFIGRQQVIHVSTLVASLFVTMIINLDIGNFNGYFVIILQIFETLLLAIIFDRKTITKSFIRITLLISVFSLIVTYVLPVFGLEKFLPLITNGTGLKFYFAGFAAKLGISGSYALRNYGIFSEPAAYCFYLFFAILLEITTEHNFRTRAIIISIFCFTLFTTISPIGLICSCVFMLLLCIDAARQKKFKYLLLFAVLIISCVLLIYFVDNFKDALEMVLNKTTLDSGSGQARKSVLLANLENWLKSPLFGGGLKTVVAISESFGFNTSTTGVFLSGFGLALTSIVGWFHVRMINQIVKRSLLMKLLAFILFLLVINNFSFLQNGWFWIFTLYGVLFRDEQPNYEVPINNSQGRRYNK